MQELQHHNTPFVLGSACVWEIPLVPTQPQHDLPSAQTLAALRTDWHLERWVGRAVCVRSWEAPASLPRALQDSSLLGTVWWGTPPLAGLWLSWCS